MHLMPGFITIREFFEGQGLRPEDSMIYRMIEQGRPSPAIPSGLRTIDDLLQAYVIDTLPGALNEARDRGKQVAADLYLPSRASAQPAAALMEWDAGVAAYERSVQILESAQARQELADALLYVCFEMEKVSPGVFFQYGASETPPSG